MKKLELLKFDIARLQKVQQLQIIGGTHHDPDKSLLGNLCDPPQGNTGGTTTNDQG